jgi:RHS repeat-associated protein
MQVATYVSNTTYFHHTDWLGTLRALSDPSGVAVVTCTSLAYGDSQSCNSTYSALNYTGQWWDSESNLTHFLFRQLSTTQGRWTTPDPAGMGAVSPGNPQSWNRYAYVGNNPLVFTDPLGLCFAALIDVDGNTVACYDPAGGPLVGGNMFADPPVIWIGGWPGWLGGGGWPGGGGGTGGGGSGFLPGDGVPWWDMPVPADPLTSYLWSLTNFVLFGTPIDFTQFASPTLDNSFQAPANEGTASNICRQACRAEHSACRAIGKVSGWWQNLANFWPGKGFWGGTVQGVGGPGNPASSKAAGPPILINGKDASDIGGAVSDHCDQDALICNDSCKPANVPRTFPL